MTSEEMRVAFRSAVDVSLAGLSAVSVGACDGCDECYRFLCDSSNPTEEEREAAEEPNFSSSWCDGCGSSFGGDRHPAHAYLESPHPATRLDHLIHLEVCCDCVQYIANGEEPQEWDASPAAYRERIGEYV